MITIINEQNVVPIDEQKIEKTAQNILDILNYSHFDLGILLTTEQLIHEYNKRYRNRDKPTDILSFPFHPKLQPGERIEPQTPDEKNLGDIILCPEYIQKTLDQWNMDFDQRLKVLLVHGICHLLGYDHIKDEDFAIMKKKEDEILKKLEHQN